MSNLDVQPGLQACGLAPQTNEQRAQQAPDAGGTAADRVALQRALLVGGIAGVAATSRMGQPG